MSGILNPLSFIDNLLDEPPTVEPPPPAPPRLLRPKRGPKARTPEQIARRQANLEEDRALEQRRVERLNSAFIESLGNIEELKSALAQCDSPKVQQFLSALLNPRFGKWPIGALASHHNISPAALADIWRRYNLSKGMLTVIGGIPKVAQDIVEDARSTQQSCERCDGWGKIATTTSSETAEPPVKKTCPQCKGKGWTRKPGDPASRKYMLQTVGWIDKGSAVSVSVNVNSPTVETIIDDLETTIDVPPLPALPPPDDTITDVPAASGLE